MSKYEEEGPPTPRVPQQDDTCPEERKPWERQEGEGEKEWAAFLIYRDMHKPRSFRRPGLFKGIASDSSVARWHRDWRWAERAEAWDVLTQRIVDAQRRKILEQSVEDLTADMLDVLGNMGLVCAFETAKYAERAQVANGPGLLKPGDLKGWVEAYVKLTRLVKGETTEKLEMSADAKEMDIEEVRAFHARLKEIRKNKVPSGPN